MRERRVAIVMLNHIWRWVIQGWREPIYELHYYGEVLSGCRKVDLVKWEEGRPGFYLEEDLMPTFLKHGRVMASKEWFYRWVKDPPMTFRSLDEEIPPHKMEIISKEEAALILFGAEESGYRNVMQ